MADSKDNRLSQMSGRKPLHGTAERMYGERFRERKSLWRVPTFWVIVGFAVIALLLMLLSSCGRVDLSDFPAESTQTAAATPSHAAGTQPATGNPPLATPAPSSLPSPSGTSSGGPDDPFASDSWLAPWGEATPDGLRYGYADAAGNLVIPAKYAHVRPFTAQGLAVVTHGEDSSGVIDRSGREIVPLQQAYIQLGDEGPILVSPYSDEYDFLSTDVYDASGNLLFHVEGTLSLYSEGLALLYHGETSGYVDLQGNLVIQTGNEILNDFQGGVARVGKKYGGPEYYIDTTGKDVTATVSAGLSVYLDDAASRFGYLRADGTRLTDPLFVEAEPFRDGTAIASVNPDPNGTGSLYGLLDTEGRWLLEPVHSGIRRMQNGLFAVGEPMREPMWAYEPYMDYTDMALYTSTGTQILDHALLSIENADNRRVSVSDGRQIWLVDETGAADPAFKPIAGNGSVKIVREKLWGTVNGIPSVYRADGSAEAIFRTGTHLGEGLKLVSAQAVGNRYTNLSYPVLRGLSDANVQAHINDRIRTLMGTGLTEEPVVHADTGLRDIETVEGGWQGWRVGRVLVVEQYPYWFAFGAAHGMPGIITVQFNLDTGNEITMADLFLSDSLQAALTFLSEKVSAIIQRDMEEVMYFVEEVEVTPAQPFRLTQSGLELYWAPYEIASYAAYYRDFLISWQDLEPFIDKSGAAWKAISAP